MSFTRRAVVSATDNSGTPALTIATASYSQASGDLLTVYVKWEGSAGTCTVADVANGALTGLTAAFDAGTNTHSQWFYKINSGASAVNIVTATFSIASTYLGVYVARYIPAATAALVDNTHNTGAAFSDPSVGPITAADLGLFGVSETSGQNAAPGTGWTEQIDDGTVIGAHFFDRIDSPGGNITGTCTITSQPPWQGVVASFSDLSGTPPTITDVDTDEVITSTQTGVVWTGTFFGSSQGASTANIVQGTTTVAQTATAWSATSITTSTVFDSGAIDLKYGTANANVNIIGNGSANLAIYINPPDARSWVDLTSINPVTTERVVSSPDIAIGDQLEVVSVKGGTISDVTLNADGSWNAAASVTEFNFRVWSSADSTWGTSAPQSTVVYSPPAPTRRHYAQQTGLDALTKIQSWFDPSLTIQKWFDMDMVAPPAGTVVNVPVGTLTLTGQVPTVTATANQFISVPVGTLTMTAYAPSAVTGGNVVVQVPVGTLTLTAQTPTVTATANQFINVPTREINLTGYAPDVLATVAIDIPVATLTMTGYAPDVLADVITEVPQVSGGWGYLAFETHILNRRKRKKELQEAREAEERIQEEIDRNIAELLHEQERKDEERKDLERIRTLVREYKQLSPVEIDSDRVQKALMEAQRKASTANLERLQREFERMLEEEEHAVLMLLASLD